MFFVYLIENLVNGKLYVGKTANVAKRWKDHTKIARGGKRYHKDYHYLHASISKYGEENFTITTIYSCESEQEAFDNEVIHIAKLKTAGHKLYNLTDGGEGASGVKPSDETKRKISASLLGNTRRRGKKTSDETKQKLSLAGKGRKTSEETKHKISLTKIGNLNPNYGGKSITDETRLKMSIASSGNTYRLGIEHTKESKEKISLGITGPKNPMFGKHHSDETKRKISLALKKKKIAEE